MADVPLGDVGTKLSSFPCIHRASSTSEHPAATWSAVRRWVGGGRVWNKTEAWGRICPSEGPTVKQQRTERSMSPV